MYVVNKDFEIKLMFPHKKKLQQVKSGERASHKAPRSPDLTNGLLLAHKYFLALQF